MEITPLSAQGHEGSVPRWAHRRVLSRGEPWSYCIFVKLPLLQCGEWIRGDKHCQRHRKAIALCGKSEIGSRECRLFF